MKPSDWMTPDVMAAAKLLYADKIADMLESREWEAPTVYDNLPRGIRVLVDILTHANDLDETQKELAVRWVREATELLEQGPTSAQRK